ncbi:hypothetical protein, partial [Candidatus Frankia alpina]|uniref:hypothetical protein n=1 Tax=Candidatus Frankia alpina TaxID=2699483 RepID=UPI001967077A
TPRNNYPTSQIVAGNGSLARDFPAPADTKVPTRRLSTSAAASQRPSAISDVLNGALTSAAYLTDDELDPEWAAFSRNFQQRNIPANISQGKE